MVVVLRELTYRELVSALRLYEPVRTGWTAGAGLLLSLAVPGLAIGGFVLGAYLADDLRQPVRVVLGALIALGPGQLLSGFVWRRKPWRLLAARRLAVYSTPPRRPDGTAWLLVSDEDLPLAWRVLSRARLYSGNAATRMGAAPPDAPSLCNRVSIIKSDALRKPGDRGAAESARAAFAAAGIRARIDGVDVS